MITQQEMVASLLTKVPSMVKGFTVKTPEGDITIPAGWMSVRIKADFERVLQSELLYQTRADIHAAGATNGK
jgi:hypothetical protein